MIFEESLHKPETKAPWRKPIRKTWLMLSGIIVIAGSIFAFLNMGKAEAPEPIAETLTVQVAKPTVQEFTRSAVLTGTIAARDPLQIGAELSGLEVKEILAEEGQFVKKGQVLARLDTAVLDANLCEEQGQLQTAKATWQKSLQPNRKESIAVQKAAYQSSLANITQKQSAIQKALAEYYNSVSIAERYRQLYEDGGATAQDVEQRNTDVQSYLAALNTAREALNQAKFSAIQDKEKLQELNAGGRSEDILAAKGTVQQHEAKIASLRAQIDQAQIRAPESGIVSERLLHIGDISTAGQVMFKLISKGELELQAKVSVDDLPQIGVGQKVTIASEEESITGTVWMVSPIVDSVTRLGRVRVALANPGKLKNGMFVTATIAMASLKAAIVIPDTALLTVNGDNFVYVENNGRVKLTPVAIGNRSDHLVQVRRGLTGSEQVVQQGVAFLSDNDAVRIRRI